MKKIPKRVQFLAMMVYFSCVQFVKELLCKHEYEPRYHSYYCPKCHKLDME